MVYRNFICCIKYKHECLPGILLMHDYHLCTFASAYYMRNLTLQLVKWSTSEPRFMNLDSHAYLASVIFNSNDQLAGRLGELATG